MRALHTLALLASSAWLLVSGQTDDVCRIQDRTYSPEAMPAGSHQPYDKLSPAVGGLSTKFYITVVNLTPHRLRLANTHSYQMDAFDFGDVPPGRARQNAVKYRGGLSRDDAGEAYYLVDGADQRFAVRVKSYSGPRPRRVVLDLSGMGLGQREYVFPGGDTAVSLVVAGSRRLGFRASLRHGPGNWMRGLYDVIGDRPVRHLVMPGAHDAGMSKITNKITSIGSRSNTQNQGVSIYDQLRAGARWLDLRVGSMAGLAVGNTGESLDEVIGEINRFTSESPGEIIFLPIRYLVGRYAFPDGGPILWGAAMVGEFFARLRGINNRCLDLDTSTGFQNHRASYLMDQNAGKGCVIPLLSGRLGAGVPRESPGDGIYDIGRMGIDDRWSDQMRADVMAPDQIGTWRSAVRGGAADHGNLVVAQWLVTPDAVAATAYSLQSFAIQPTNPSLYWAGVNGMDPEHWPNVVLVDYLGVQQRDQWAWDSLSAEMYTLAVGMNLYMASENCDVNRRRGPLRSAPKVSRGVPWNGIIFANGTTVDRPPPGIHPGRAAILRSGTVLGNGTVLAASVPNPWL
ncbi:PLC-like phosphodiesterase [Trichocladium antarcticum]|uniref:PLC-like phosphodiesterase n=1 Tax=Trichocladium antarcticum TaxID=1450529 RepID=A0AAN6UEM6_9PEZI|nr:PLC-like phosphodiesterase [Trichocladium antarcticum]